VTESTALDRVRRAVTEHRPPKRSDVESALRECFGLTRSQAKWFAAEGARSLDPSRSGATAEALERARALVDSLGTLKPE